MTELPDYTDFNGLEAVHLQSPDGAKAVITRQGAQLVSWIPAGGKEQLYLSPDSFFEPEMAIRGGVPIIFPQFADTGPLHRHGFARLLPWRLSELREDGKSVLAVFTLEADEVSYGYWAHPFKAEFTVALEGQRLDMELEVENPDQEEGEPFSFTAALHTYLKVKEVEESTLTGLHGATYLDRCDLQEYRDTGTELQVEEEVDRLYPGITKPLMLQDGDRTLGIYAEGFPDLVVWNPWEEKCGAMDDMPPSGFRYMLCVEAAAVAQPIELAPGETWWGRQSLVVV